MDNHTHTRAPARTHARARIARTHAHALYFSFLPIQTFRTCLNVNHISRGAEPRCSSNSSPCQYETGNRCLHSSCLAALWVSGSPKSNQGWVQQGHNWCTVDIRRVERADKLTTLNTIDTVNPFQLPQNDVCRLVCTDHLGCVSILVPLRGSYSPGILVWPFVCSHKTRVWKC